MIRRDKTFFRLSKVQLDVLCCWRRPGEVLEQAHLNHQLKPTMTPNGKVDLVQDITTDCSVVASLCAISARTERGHPDVTLPYTCNISLR